MKTSWSIRLTVMVLAGVLGACSSTSGPLKDSSPTDTRVDSSVMKEASVDLNRDAQTRDTAVEQTAPKDSAMADSGPLYG